MKYFREPLRFVEPESDNDVLGPRIVDANGSLVASLYWPTHPTGATEAAEQETYALGRAFVTAVEVIDGPASDQIRDLACCDTFVRESASEFCATCGYTNLDHLRKRSSHETRELQLLKEARSFIQHDKRCWGASHEDDCTCGYVDFAKKLAFLDEPAKEICAHGKRRDEDCAYCPGSFSAPPIDPWADMKKNCTCPKPGTSSSKIDPLCPIGLPHPWDRDAQKASESPETCHRNGQWSGCWRVRCNLGKKCALGKSE